MNTAHSSPPSSDTVHAQAAQLCDSGRHEEAAALLDAELASSRLDGVWAQAAALRAKIAHYADDQDLAHRLLSQVELITPYAPSATVLHGRVLTAMDREDETWMLLEGAARARPNSLPILFNLARMCVDPDRLKTFYELWLGTRPHRAAFAATVRPLLTACTRARDFGRGQLAVQRAVEIILSSQGAISPQVRDRTLGGEGRRALLDVVDALDAGGVPHFLAAGTALGAVREGHLLGFDTDVDIGIFERDYDRAALISLFRANPAFRLQEIDPNSPKIGLQHWNGIMIDLFSFYEEEGRIWHSGVFTRWWNTPFDLAPLQLYGRDMNAPAPAEAYLEECYGDWRTPAADFDAFFEGPNAEIVWPEYFHLYIQRKFFELICMKNYALAERYVRKFPQLFKWLDKAAFRSAAAMKESD